MRDASAFETLLARSVAAHARRVDRPFDPRAIAEAATVGQRTSAEQAFGSLNLRARLALVGLVMLLVVGLAVAGARLLEPRPLGWGSQLYYLSDMEGGGTADGGPYLYAVTLGTEDAPVLVAQLEASRRGLTTPNGLASLSQSGRFAVVAAASPGRPGESTAILIDTQDGAISSLPDHDAMSWAPDTDRLAWSDRDGITILDAVSGQSSEVFFGRPRVLSLAWADSSTLEVETGPDLQCHTGPTGDPQGSTGVRCTPIEFWRVPVDGDPVVLVADFPGFISHREASFSPDRSLAAYVIGDVRVDGRADLEVWVHRPDGSGARRLASVSLQPGWLAEGQRWAGLPFVWSADSRTLSWVAADQLWVVGVDGGGPITWRLPESLPGAAGAASLPFQWRLPS